MFVNMLPMMILLPYLRNTYKVAFVISNFYHQSLMQGWNSETFHLKLKKCLYNSATHPILCDSTKKNATLFKRYMLSFDVYITRFLTPHAKNNAPHAVLYLFF